MADAATQTSDQSSSQGASPQTSSGASQQGTSSQGTQTSGQTEQTQQTSQQQASSGQTQAPARPAYVPESYWDATAGKVKETEFAEHFNQLQTRVAAEDSRKLTLPAKPEDYKVELPGDFKLPAGIEFKLDASNPLWSQGQAWAQKHGLTQEAFQEAIALVAGDRVGTQAQVDAARNAEIGKLGVNGPARVTAVKTWAQGMIGEQAGAQFVSRLFTASDVQMAEALIAKFSGSGSFRSTGREPPDQPGRKSADDVAKMSLQDQLAYARQFKQPQHDGRAA